MTSGNWLQHCSRNPMSQIHYHLLSSSNVQTYCYLPLLTSSTSLFVMTAWPTCLKSAVLSPLLKKPDADFLQFNNFRPISNLKAKRRSKIIEKSVALQLNNSFDTVSLEILLDRLSQSTLWYYTLFTRMVRILPIISYTMCSN